MQEITEPFTIVHNQPSDSMANNNPPQQLMRNCVEHALKNYFAQLEGAQPAHLYKLALAEFEIPLLQMVLVYTKGNQTKAAEILGLSRGTFRKKLKEYQLD